MSDEIEMLEDIEMDDPGELSELEDPAFGELGLEEGESGSFDEADLFETGELEGLEEFDEFDEFGDYESDELVGLEDPDAFDPQIIGRDTRRLVRNTRRVPFRYFVNLEYRLDNGQWRAMCSGTLIGPRTVLTAGHCIRGMQASRLRVYPGRNGGSAPFGRSTATALKVYPGYAGSSPTDLGIIHLATPLGQRVGYWRRARPRNWRSRVDPRGTSMSALIAPRVRSVNVSGYPADMPSGARYGCRDRTRPAVRCHTSFLNSPTRLAICGALQYRAYNRTVTYQGGMLHYLNDTCPGHSGSPVWVLRTASRGGRTLIGVHVAGDDNVGTVANRAVAFTPLHLAWIARNTR